MRRHDDVDDERLRLRRLKDEARNIAGDENKDRRVDYNNSLPAGCLERKRSSFPAGWSHREAASGHHGPPPVGSPEWQPRLHLQQQHRLQQQQQVYNSPIFIRFLQSSTGVPQLGLSLRLQWTTTGSAQRRGDRQKGGFGAGAPTLLTG